MIESRGGHFIRQKEGYQAFVPKELPPDPPLIYNAKLQALLSDADRALARLDGMAMILPNVDLFVAMFMKKEALISSQIEGTQASLKGVLEFEAKMPSNENINDIREVLNYLKAMDHGLKNLKSGPISLDLIKVIHRILIEGTRGSRFGLGEFRTEQNYIGRKGGTILQADFIPPPPGHVPDLMINLEKFINSEDELPPLVKIALIHSQFETIHPFLDGNGRMGRLLITFYLCGKGILSSPLLYLSLYINRHKEEYMDLLNTTRTEGDLESWVRFFMQGVVEVSKEAGAAAKEIIELKESVLGKLVQNDVAGANAVRLANMIFNRPIISITEVAESLEVSNPTALKLVTRFEEIGILTEITGKQRFKKYLFTDYVAIIERGTKG
jgi:Fic family protein